MTLFEYFRSQIKILIHNTKQNNFLALIDNETGNAIVMTRAGIQ